MGASLEAPGPDAWSTALQYGLGTYAVLLGSWCVRIAMPLALQSCGV